VTTGIQVIGSVGKFRDERTSQVQELKGLFDGVDDPIGADAGPSTSHASFLRTHVMRTIPITSPTFSCWFWVSAWRSFRTWLGRC
jgi:hypothetical protein